MRKITIIGALTLLFLAMPTFAQKQVQRGIARMITRTAADPIVPVSGVQVVVGNVASKASDNNGRFSLDVKVNKEQTYSLTDVRLPKGSKLMLASPSKKKKLFLDKNDLEVSLISKDEKDMVSKANYNKLREKYKAQTEKVFKLRNQLDEKLVELNESSKEYAIVKAKKDSVQKLLSLYYDDKIYEQTLKDLQTIAEDLALTDYQSLDSIEARIYRLKMEGDWQTISDVLIRLMGGNASAWLHAKLERRNQAAKDFAMGMEMIKEAIEAFKMQHLNDSVSYYYEILVKADSTNCNNLNAAGEWEREFMSHYDKALLYHFKALKYASNDTLKAATLSFIGNVYEDKDEHKKAGEYYDEALVLMKHYTHYDYAPVMAKFYDNIGRFYLKTGNTGKAFLYFREAEGDEEIDDEEDVDEEDDDEEDDDDENNILKNPYHEIVQSQNPLRNKYLGDYELYRGFYKESLYYYNKALNIQQSKTGESSIEVASCHSDIGRNYLYLCDYLKALSHQQKALEILKPIVGESNPLCIKVYVNIGSIYEQQGAYKLALDYYTKALNFLNGIENLTTATIFNNIGNIYYAQGKEKLSIEYIKKAIEIRERIYADKHYDTFIAYSNLGCVYMRQGNISKALEYCKKSLSMLQRYHESKDAWMDSRNEDIAKCYDNMGDIYARAGYLFGAKNNYKNAWNMRKRNSNQYLVLSCSKIGYISSKLGDYENTRKFCASALEILNNNSYKKTPTIAEVYNNIGRSYYYMGIMDSALIYQHKALEIQMDFWGEDNYNVAKTYCYIGQIYNSKHDYTKSLEYHTKSLDILKGLSAETLLDIMNLDDIAMVAANSGKYEKALELQNMALKYKKIIFGERHPFVASNYNEIAKVYNSKGEKALAWNYFQQALEMIKDTLTEENTFWGKYYYDLGTEYYEEKNYNDAWMSYQKMWRCYERPLEVPSENRTIEFADICNKIGERYKEKRSYYKAIEYFQKALDIQIEQLGEYNLNVAKTYRNIGYCHSSEGNAKIAFECFKKSLEIRSAILGENHIEVASDNVNMAAKYYYTFKKYCLAVQYYIKAADIYYMHKDYKNALRQYESARLVYENNKDCEDEKLAKTLERIGRIYMIQENYDRSLDYYSQAISVKKNISDGNVADIDVLCNAIGCIYAIQGHQEKAALYLGRTDGFSKEKPSLQSVVKEYNQLSTVLAVAYSDTAKINFPSEGSHAALRYFQKALNLYISADNKIGMMKTYNNIGLISENSNEALTYFQQALDLSNKNDKSSATIYVNMGKAYLLQRDYSHALEHYQKALSIYLNTGEKEKIVEMYNNIGDAYVQYAGTFTKRDYNKAIEQSNKALEYYKKAENKDKIITCHSSMVDYYCYAKQYDKALAQMSVLKKIVIDEYGDDSPMVAAIYFSMGEIYQKQNKLDNALESHKQALDIRIYKHGVFHADVAKSYIEIGIVYDEQGNKKKALEYFQKAFDVRKYVFGLNHRLTKDVQELINLLKTEK